MIGSNSNNNSKTRHPKFISFYINDISSHSYSEQFTNDKTNEKVVETQISRNNQGDGNGHIYSKHLKFVNFFINN